MRFEHIIIDLIINYFDFFTMELFTLSLFQYRHTKQTTIIRWCFLTIYLIISIIPHIPYITVLDFLLAFSYIYLISSFHFKNSLFFFLKYELISNAIFSASYLFCALTNINAYSFVANSNIYFDYQSVTGIMLVYIALNLYNSLNRLKKLQAKTYYPIVFSILSIAIVLLLLVANRYLARYDAIAPLFPYFYLFVIGILVLSLNSYRKIIEFLETQTTQKIILEKYKMELSYFNNVQDTLKSISHIRHDFKNHLIVLDGYAEQNRIHDIRNYIAKINTEIVKTKIYDTPNELISSILDTKNTVCQKQNIKFHANWAFPFITLSDYMIITILGNILDNAITAAAKTAHGFIELNILQVDNYLEISCKNNYNEIIVEKDGHFISTKQDSDIMHGFGLLNVQNCVNAANGKLEIKYDTKQFEVIVLLPNYY